MRHRRKLHGLAGSAAHHAEKARPLEARALNMFRASGSLAYGLRCGLALDEYADAVRAMGMAQVHLAESGASASAKSSEYGSLRDNFKLATQNFKDRCIATENLRGMPRRRRRK
jgi:hypothetical protein